MFTYWGCVVMSELKSCVTRWLSLISVMVSEDVKEHLKKNVAIEAVVES